jgi:glycerophosphoryl diester phosphodiesterase
MTAGPRPLVLAHRGALEERTENTLPAFELALERGADGVELDVRRTNDGAVVVFHDEDLLRLADRDLRIEAATRDQLDRIELHGAGRIPTLAQVVERLPASAWLDVELKGEGDALVDATLACLAGREHVLLTSFDPRRIARARAQGFSGPTGLLLEAQSPGFLHAQGGREFGADGVILDAALCSPSSLARHRARGEILGTFGARDPAHERWLVAQGVHWLITDWPRGTV